MKREYYHYCITCPNCHEPHFTGSQIEVLKPNIYRCNSCKTLFRNELDLTKFEKTSNFLLQKNEAPHYLKKIPLIWKVTPNIIEESYLEWISKCKKGKYLITWPWNKVKFIPLLISEFMHDNPNKKVVVFGNVSENNPEKINYPGLNVVFEHIIYLDQKTHLINDYPDLKSEMNKFSKKDVLIKSKRTSYIVRRIRTAKKAQPRREKDLFDGSVEKCKKYLFKEIAEEYGLNSIRKYEKIPSNRKPRILNEKGILDVLIEESPRWVGELKYNNLRLWTVLINSNQIHSPSMLNENYTAIFKEDIEDIPLNANVYFINDSIDLGNVYETILKIDPDLVIFQNADNCIIGNKSRDTLNFLDHTESTVLMFSTKPEIRNLFNNKGFNEKDITLHTWDSPILMEKIIPELPKIQSHSPVSSTVTELPNYGEKPHVEYLELEILNKIDEIIPEVSKINKNHARYLEDLKKTPLIVRGECRSPCVFNRFIFGSIIHYDNLMANLRRDDETLFMKLKEIFETIYSLNDKQENPLLIKLIELIKKIISNENLIVSVIVHGSDVNGTKKILEENGFSKYIPHRVSVLPWKKLSLRELELEKNKKHIVISTRPPSFDYNLYASKNVKKFIFLGSRKDIKKTEDIIETRLNEENSRPLIGGDFDAPELLQNLLKNLDIKDDSFNKEEIVIEEDFGDYKFYEIPRTAQNKIKYRQMIKSGDCAVLIYNERSECMFLPLNKFISFRAKNKGEIIDEIQIKRTQVNKIKNKELILNKHGFYTSFKHVFTKFMFKNSQNIKFRGGTFTWNSFEELLNDSSEWIRILRQTVKELAEKYEIDMEEAGEKLSRYLASLNLNAKNKEYIKKWWAEPEMLSVNYESVPIYDIERPKSLEDLKKIYKGLNVFLKNENLNSEEAEKSYLAARTLQKIRRSFFKKQINQINPQYKIVYQLLRNEINRIIEHSDSFKVKNAINVKIRNEAPALELLNEEDCSKYL